ncbi:MAG: glycosyltransferase family 39 protein, partial [Chloroflexota bacterium]|nr:glycosyltransferase family 39 protein [Chloroflexota bacterium]
MATAASKQNRALTLPGLRLGVIGAADLRNLGFIFAGFLGVLLLIPPPRIYPVTDDWIYSQSVSELTRLAYKPHDWTQPIAIGHLAWGAVWAALFGNTFTVLTLANMVMSLACLFTFYLLLRQLRVQSGPAFFGVALLGFNPIYIYISYSFMTDVTFLFYLLAACLLYIRGLQGRGERWLWLGGVATALAYLTRQYGILAIIAALIYMCLLEKRTWRQAVSIAAIPLVAVAGYAFWARFQPSPLIDTQMDLVHKQMLQQPLRYLDGRMLHIAWLVTSLGACMIPLLSIPRRVLWSLPVLAFVLYYQFEGLHFTGSLFPQNGNVIDSTGLLMYGYDANPVWHHAVWSILGAVGGVAFSFLFLYWVRELRRYISARPWRNRGDQDPAFVPYALAFM